MLAGLSVLAPIVEKLLGFIPDPNERARAQQELLTALINAQNAQLDVNKTEAQHTSLFVAGWRPFIGWTCGCALAYQFILRPLLPWLAMVSGTQVPEMPNLDDSLMELVMAMLGLGGLRTFEKIKGVARK
ncbi:MAG: 3TM-type holin [Burkholderiaceae bacterium]